MKFNASERLWWQKKPSLLSYGLRPLSWPFSIASLWRKIYLRQWQKPFKAPVVIIGNISVGGNGKTPFIIALVIALKAHGFKPGVVSRGYGTKIKAVKIVTADANCEAVGDEPLLIAKKTKAPVVVCPNRNQAIETLLDNFDCDIVLSDDGLQHYKMHRDVEIALIDSHNQLGNGFLLPAGPLREPVHRLKNVDFVLSDKSFSLSNQQKVDRAFSIRLNNIYGLADKKSIALERLKSYSLTAITGIAKPWRFFKLLADLDLEFESRVYPDHHAFSAKDLMVSEGFILMTEKDALKCEKFSKNIIVFAIEYILEPAFMQDFIHVLQTDKVTTYVNH